MSIRRCINQASRLVTADLIQYQYQYYDGLEFVTVLVCAQRISLLGGNCSPAVLIPQPICVVLSIVAGPSEPSTSARMGRIRDCIRSWWRVFVVDQSQHAVHLDNQQVI